MQLQKNKKRDYFIICASIVIFISILFCVAENSQADQVQGIKLQTSGGPYETSLGKLNSTFLLQNGNQMGTDSSGGLTIVFGFIHIQSDEGVNLKKNIDIYHGKTNLSPNITFVQDLKTKNWIATDGVMCIHKGSTKLLDNTTVKIIGGKDSPIKIGGKEFYETSVTIKNGQPM